MSEDVYRYSFYAIATGTEAQRVEALREFLGYPLQELDRTGSRFWYVRAGQDIAQARNTCPIAVGFYEELDRLSDFEIKDFLVDKPQQQRIYGHYQNQEPENTPVMYLLLPVAERVGRVAIVLPAEGKLRKSQIQIFVWDSDDLKARLGRLQWGTMQWANKITETALLFLPNVDWVFYKPIETAKELALQLALVTRRIEQAISDVFAKEQANDYLQRLLESFKRELLPSLKPFAENEKDYSFADIYAQTIAYGLFTARVFRQVRDRKEQKTIPTYFTREDAWDCLPETNPFLRQLFKDVSEHSLDEFGDELSDGILEIFSILRAAKMDALLSDFEQKMNREDIVIRFYEDFLAAYKPKMRERRGVYYTPEPWNHMTLEQRIGRIDRPKQHKAENIVIYYANSESQLLRQASRLKNLNKKLVGDLATPDGEISNVTDVNTLGASVYGDTLFDDPILPGYVDFIQSLAKSRNMEHINLQEEVYRQQENSHDLYTG